MKRKQHDFYALTFGLLLGGIALLIAIEVL